MCQICSLVSVDLAEGCIDFVSICIFLPAKNTFISSTKIDAGNSSSSFLTFCCVGPNTMAVFFSQFIQGSLFFFLRLKLKSRIVLPEQAVSIHVTNGLRQCTSARKTRDDLCICQRSETLLQVQNDEVSFTPLPADPGSACQSWHGDIVATSYLITILIHPSQSPNDTAAGRLISKFDLASVHSS